MKSIYQSSIWGRTHASSKLSVIPYGGQHGRAWSQAPLIQMKCKTPAQERDYHPPSPFTMDFSLEWETFTLIFPSFVMLLSYLSHYNPRNSTGLPKQAFRSYPSNVITLLSHVLFGDLLECLFCDWFYLQLPHHHHPPKKNKTPLAFLLIC